MRVLESQGNLELPNDYSPSNAMKQAWLQISQDNKLMSCNDTSKANALLDMVTQGLNPAKINATLFLTATKCSYNVAITVM